MKKAHPECALLLYFKFSSRPCHLHGTGAYSFTASFRAFPALNPGTFDALIWIVAPVWGLRPSRAARGLTENVPKPTRDTWSPRLRASVTLSITASSARPASDLLMSAADAIASIRSVLFTKVPCKNPVVNAVAGSSTHIPREKCFDPIRYF
jgi:hypothetical protein